VALRVLTAHPTGKVRLTSARVPLGIKLQPFTVLHFNQQQHRPPSADIPYFMRISFDGFFDGPQANSQIARKVLSLLLMILLPLALKQTERTTPVCPLKVRIRFPLATSHSASVISGLPESAPFGP